MAEVRQSVQTPGEPEVRPASPVTARSVVLGLGMVALLDVWVIYAEYILQSSRLNVDHHFPVSLFAVFVVLLVLSNLGHRLGGRGLSRSELLVVLSMGLTGIVIPSNGLTSYLLGSLSAPYYFATPENGWSAFHPYLRTWIAPENMTALRWFFEGLPPGRSIPWEAWVVPLAWWAALGCGFILVSACIACIFRRQWAQHERLVYPILIPALEMVQSAEGEGWLPEFTRARLFRVGFAVSFGILCWNMLNYFQPAIPQIPIQGHWFSMARGFPYTFHTRINFFTVGFAYFANVSVLFSVWFFFVLMNLEMLAMNRVGYTIPMGGGVALPAESNPMITWQTTGAFLVFVGWTVWTAREHLGKVVRIALGRGEPIDDSGEMMSYRFAVWGTVGGSVFILSWLCAAGMELHVAVVLLAALFIGYFGVAKMVAEIGLLYTPSTLNAEGFVVATVGTANMSPGSITMLAFSQNMVAYNKGMVLPPLTHVARLGDFIGDNRRRLFAAVGAALAASYVVSTGYTIWLGYTGGAYNFNAYPFSYYSQRIFDRVVYRMDEPWQIDRHRLAFLAIGGAGMAVLTMLRYRVSWWDLHPIGFALPRMTWEVFSLFLAWACKSVILRIGGEQLYRRSRPLFIGLLAGYALGVVLSSVVDWTWFPGQGHSIHSW